jgi:uncharacterized membrane protein
MATLSQAKILGGVGAILVFIPFVSLIGYILILVAINDISNDLQDRTIFNNVLIAAVTGIIGALAGATVAFAIFTTSFGAGFLSAIFGVILGLFIAWIFLIISALYLRRAYSTMSQKLGVGTFGTAGTLYFIGAILTIVLVGFLLLFVAEIVQAVAYFSIPDKPPGGFNTSPPPVGTPASMAPQGDGTKFCASCGAKISASATFCNICGAKQPGN